MTREPPCPHVGRVVRKEIEITADAARVYEAWADPERIATWFVDRAEGDMRTDDVVAWIFDGFGALPIQVLAREDGTYLAFGGEPPGRPPALQEVEILQRDGKTVLRLANSGFGEGADWDEEYAGVDSGWDLALATLKLALERHPGRSRRRALVMHPATFEYADVAPYYFTGAGLESWLAATAQLGADPLRVGSPVRIETRAGPTIEGTVLARSGWEMLIDWPERQSAVGLKAFKMGPAGRVVAATYDDWSGDDGTFEASRALLDDAFATLAGRLGAAR